MKPLDIRFSATYSLPRRQTGKPEHRIPNVDLVREHGISDNLEFKPAGIRGQVLDLHRACVRLGEQKIDRNRRSKHALGRPPSLLLSNRHGKGNNAPLTRWAAIQRELGMSTNGLELNTSQDERASDVEDPLRWGAQTTQDRRCMAATSIRPTSRPVSGA
jgi:hypothetical protein